MVKKVIHPVQLFLIAWIFWIAIAFILWLIYPKGILELAWNKNHHPFQDIFFFIVSGLGNGLTFGFFVLMFAFIDRRKFLIAASSALVCLLVSLMMKQYLFKGEKRPLAFFSETENIHLPDGASILLFGSFPSGHTLSAFAMFLLAAFFIKNKIWQLLFFLSAAMVGLSRIYLMAHFKEDVLTGSIIGVSISLIVISIFQYYFPESFTSPLIRIRRNGKKI